MIKGPALDQESKQYAAATLSAIVPQWDVQAVEARVSAEFKATLKDGDLEKMIHLYQKLGPFQGMKDLKGEATLWMTARNGLVISASTRRVLTLKMAQPPSHWA